MRGLKPTFLAELASGFLAELTREVKKDSDLDLEIRNNYINLYYKGHSLLKLTQAPRGRYRVDVHKEFGTANVPPELIDEGTTRQFVTNIPAIKRNIQQCSVQSIETEYEQLFIRANNYERRVNSEYFVLDRQYVVGKERFDLMGFVWQQPHAKNQTVQMCLMEVKYGLNPDIRVLHEQLKRYYHQVKDRAVELAAEAEKVFQQKLALGLYDQTPSQRKEALGTLKISREFSDFQFIVILIDYNPGSKLLKEAMPDLKQLPFAKQIRLQRGGLALWDQDVRDLDSFRL